MLTDLSLYEGPHNSIRRRVKELESDLLSLARREEQHSRHDDAGNRALAEERTNMYKDIRVIADHVIGGLEDIEAHVKQHPNGWASNQS